MEKAGYRLSYLVVALLLAPLPGCSDDAEDDNNKVIAMGAALQVYADVAANPIPTTASATSTAWDQEGKLKLALRVAGFPASRDFGAHLKVGAYLSAQALSYTHHIAKNRFCHSPSP